jgi:hypothetical protein
VSINDEKEIAELVTSNIQDKLKYYNIENKHYWIFSQQNLMSSKMRVCTRCFNVFIHPHRWNPEASWCRVRKVFFAVKEYERRQTPIKPGMSNYEKYIISLPERATLSWRHFGDEIGDDWCYFECDMKGNLTIALDPDYQPADLSWKDFRANFFQDKNRLIPNDQELTRWMKKQINDYYDRHECYKDWNRVQFCKIFVNPKTLIYPIRRNDKKVYNTRYTVVVHYSIPKGDWDEYDI